MDELKFLLTWLDLLIIDNYQKNQAIFFFKNWMRDFHDSKRLFPIVVPRIYFELMIKLRKNVSFVSQEPRKATEKICLRIFRQ